jgi:GTPase
MSQPTRRASERAFCIAALPDDENLAELGELLRTAGVEVVGETIQRRERPHPNTYLGPGKVREAKETAFACDANVIVCDDELSARQERNLEQALGLPVVDRTTVILDIFATHASSAEGKLQVELAQLEYNLARMRGLWTHLERLGGGIGTRGPGETQIETDRRLARNRIAALRRRLEHVKGTRSVMRAERERAALPNIALVGYTNAGKSTLLNALTGAEVGVRDRLFHTLDPSTRMLRIDGRAHLLTDTVGFIRKLPHQVVDAFGATLQETLMADLLLHVLDASAPEHDQIAMRKAVEDVLEEIGAGQRPRVLVLNKIDLLDQEASEELRLAHPDAVLVSGRAPHPEGGVGVGLTALEQRIEQELRHTLRPMELLVPYSQGGSLAELHDVAGDLRRQDTPEGVLVRALVPIRLAERYARFAVANGTAVNGSAVVAAP